MGSIEETKDRVYNNLIDDPKSDDPISLPFKYLERNVEESFKVLNLEFNIVDKGGESRESNSESESE